MEKVEDVQFFPKAEARTGGTPTARAPVGRSCRTACLAVRTAGQGLVEYALMLMLIALVVIGSVSLFGTQVSSTFTEVNCRLDGGTYHEDSGMGHSNRCVMPHGGGGGHP